VSIGLFLSFVQRPADVEEARKLGQEVAAPMSKIEKPTAVTMFDVLAVSDGIMVAAWRIRRRIRFKMCRIQKQLVRKMPAQLQPVIVAIPKMLESMIDRRRPAPKFRYKRDL
jgi:pyruvate kinase